MNELKRGEFFGSHYQKINFDNITITDTEYTHPKVDWHYHEHPYFTFILRGKLFEANKKESYYLNPGSLLFHNWQDAHHNIKPPEYTRGFHIELKTDWLKEYDISPIDIEGSIQLECPLVKSLMNKLYFESKINDNQSQLSINSMLVNIFSNMKKDGGQQHSSKPEWTKKIQSMIIETNNDYTLSNLSNELNIHPVHLSRGFHKYFGSTLGQYIRRIRLNKAISLMMDNKLSLTEICYQCGFFDQSHFISCFKSIYKTNPKKYIKIISGC